MSESIYSLLLRMREEIFWLTVDNLASVSSQEPPAVTHLDVLSIPSRPCAGSGLPRQDKPLVFSTFFLLFCSPLRFPSQMRKPPGARCKCKMFPVPLWHQCFV